jgi:pimeloyl-ACP methyl ester carboxylesterase
MGRTPASGWPLLRLLRRAGLRTTTFGYSVSRESFADAAARLAGKIADSLQQEELVLVGHSLGGVLLRQALAEVDDAGGRIRHLFLLGSPIGASRLAAGLSGNPLFRLATRDCGHLLGSAKRMAAVDAPTVPTTAIAGMRGIVATAARFGAEPNDGVVSLSEVSSSWLGEPVLVPVVHTLLPSSGRVAAIILERLGRDSTGTATAA